MNEKKYTFWQMRTNRQEKENIARLARRLRVTEADAVRLAVSHLLQSGEAPHTPARLRRVAIRRKAVE